MTQTLDLSTVPETRFDFVEIVGLLWRRKWPVILGCLIGGLLGVVISMMITPRYLAGGNLVVRSAALTEPDADRAFGTTVVNEAVVSTEKDVLTSDGLLKRVAQQVDIPARLLPGESLLLQLREWLDSSGLLSANLRADVDDLIPPPDSSPEALLDQRMHFIFKALTLTAKKGSSVIEVHAVTEDPDVSAAIVNSVMRLYMQDRGDEESRAASVIESALRERLKQTRQQITEGENQLARILRQPGAIEDSEVPGQEKRLTLLGKELVNAQAELARRKAAYKDPRDLARAQATVDLLRQQMDQHRNELQGQSASTIGLHAQREAVASLWRVSDALEARLIDLTAHPMNLNARILTTADRPLRPSFPSKFIFAIAGSLLGGMATAGSLLTSNHVRGRRPLASQLAQMMNAPLLGGVPQMPAFRRRNHNILAPAVGTRGNNGFAEALFAMALELEDAVKAGSLRCITVTSAQSGEGKTTVAVALARSLASMSMRVLLIDLDLRRPHAEQTLLASDPSALDQQTQPFGDQDVRVCVDHSTGLHLMTPFNGACNDPLGYLRSASLRQAVESARSEYDMLVFDSPPAMAVPDALVIARLADATVLVAELGRNSDNEAAEMSRLLERTHRPIFGVIVTKVPADSLSYGEYGSTSRSRV